MGKEVKKKKKMNIVLYTIIMLFVFLFITEVIVWGYGGRLLAKSIIYYPQGIEVIKEAVLAGLVLIVMLLFKNSYVFTQNRDEFKMGLRYGTFYMIFACIYTLLFGVLYGGFFTGLSLLNVIIECILIGICEEFLCRGWLLNEFLERYGDTKKGVWYSIIVSGIFFGLMHFSNYFSGQDLAGTITQVISAVATGIMFGLIYYKTKNIWSVIFLHAFWDFSIFLSEIIPVTSATEIYNIVSIFGIIISIAMSLTILLNVIPHIKDIDSKPNKKRINKYAFISIIVYLVFGIAGSTITLGDTYEYGIIELDNYAITTDNYEEYKINYTSSLTYEEYSILLSNDEDSLVLTNTNTNAYVEIEYDTLSDYMIMEEEDYYIIAYIDYQDNTNPYLYYEYVLKTDLSNDSEYLTTLKDNFKKYLLPATMELVIISDYENDISYLTCYDVDYGYYLLVDEEVVDRLD